MSLSGTSFSNSSLALPAHPTSTSPPPHAMTLFPPASIPMLTIKFKLVRTIASYAPPQGLAPSAAVQLILESSVGVDAYP